MLDEFQQAFVPSRQASAIDVGIDASGAVLGQTFRRILDWRGQESRKQ